MTKMPLKGIRARATRHAEEIRDLRSQVKDLRAEISYLHQTVRRVHAKHFEKINEIVKFLAVKYPSAGYLGGPADESDNK